MTKALILHGGAGAWRIRPGVEKSIEAVKVCTERAWRVLEKTSNAVDTVVEAVKCMEDSGFLNAGYGSALNILGERELDAGLMSSTGLMGAVAAVRATRNPVLLAKLVAEKTPHVLLAGENADRLAIAYGLPPLPPPPPHVVERYKDALRKVFREEPGDPYYRLLRSFVENSNAFHRLVQELINVYDTVGAVALDDRGVLAAATSTGGILLKLPGRVGDTPIPGAGFYAGSGTACSSTGIGEQIIRAMPCLRLDQEYMLTGSLEKAVSRVMEHVEKNVGSNTMGFIAVDKEGNVAYAYNTEAMLIGYVHKGEIIAELKPEPRIRVIEPG
ncbi:MAG: isoaspartyl peptidase/L-asparaginase [Desulfurococcaceae archaeon]